MARHKKAKKKTGRSRRRMGGIGGGAMEALKLIGGATLGVLGGRLLNTTMTSMGGTIMGAGEGAVGVFVAVKAKNMFLKGMGAGFGANGLAYMAGAKGLNVLPASMGYGPPGGGSYRSMSGYRDVPKIGNFPKPNAIGSKGLNMQDQRMARMYAGVYN